MLDNFINYFNNKLKVLSPFKNEPFKNESISYYYNPIILTIYFIITCFAVYLSWRCNKQFEFIHFMFALLLPEIYIIYSLATSGMCGLLL